MHGIDALGRLEEHAVAMAPAAFLGVGGPGGETLGERELGRVRGLVREPLEDALGERELVEGAAQQLRHLRFERRAVERLRFLGLDLQHRAALHELAFHAEKRRQAMVALDEFQPLFLDAEEMRDEPVEVRRYGDEEVGFFLVLERRGIRAREEVPVLQARVRGREPADELGIDPFQAREAIEVLEFEAEGEAKRLLRGGHRRVSNRQSSRFYGIEGCGPNPPLA